MTIAERNAVVQRFSPETLLTGVMMIIFFAAAACSAIAAADSDYYGRVEPTYRHSIRPSASYYYQDAKAVPESYPLREFSTGGDEPRAVYVAKSSHRPTIEYHPAADESPYSRLLPTQNRKTLAYQHEHDGDYSPPRYSSGDDVHYHGRLRPTLYEVNKPLANRISYDKSVENVNSKPYAGHPPDSPAPHSVVGVNADELYRAESIEQPAIYQRAKPSYQQPQQDSSYREHVEGDPYQVYPSVSEPVYKAEHDPAVHHHKTPERHIIYLKPMYTETVYSNKKSRPPVEHARAAQAEEALPPYNIRPTEPLAVPKNAVTKSFYGEPGKQSLRQPAYVSKHVEKEDLPVYSARAPIEYKVPVRQAYSTNMEPSIHDGHEFLHKPRSGAVVYSEHPHVASRSDESSPHSYVKSDQVYSRAPSDSHTRNRQEPSVFISKFREPYQSDSAREPAQASGYKFVEPAEAIRVLQAPSAVYTGTQPRQLEHPPAYQFADLPSIRAGDNPELKTKNIKVNVGQEPVYLSGKAESYRQLNQEPVYISREKATPSVRSASSEGSLTALTGQSNNAPDSFYVISPDGKLRAFRQVIQRPQYSTQEESYEKYPDYERKSSEYNYPQHSPSLYHASAGGHRYVPLSSQYHNYGALSTVRR